MTWESSLATLLVGSVVRSVPLALAAWLVLRLFRVRHPASQHAVWTGVLVGMLLLAPLSMVAPHWNLAVLPQGIAPAPLAGEQTARPRESPDGDRLAALLAQGNTPSKAARVSKPETPVPTAGLRLASAIAWTYLAGLLVLVAYRLAGRILLRRVIARSTNLSLRPLRESGDIVVPVAVGWLRPSVILPRDWREWSRQTRQAVLAHEIAHIRRRDAVVATLARMVQCVFWFHPLAWWLGRTTSQLAEMACDARALERVQDPAGYSRVLLEFAQRVNRSGYRAALPGLTMGLAMASRSGLDRRVDQIFEISGGKLRKLARPGMVLALFGLPVLCLAASLSLTEAISRPLLQVKILLPAPSLPAEPLVQLAQATRGQPREAPSANAASVRKMLDEYCVRCHNEDLPGRRLLLDKADTANVKADRALWENVLRTLRARTEPPVALPRPDRAAYESTIQWLEAGLDVGNVSGGQRLSNAELANRLAAFLWSAAPDDQLARATLTDPQTLEAEARRMLADPRSKALVANFLRPWLFPAVQDAKPSAQKYPEFDESLREAFLTETNMFLEDQLAGNHGVVDLLSAEYTFANDRLARHYGIPNVTGSQFRRVSLAGTQRGGLLGQGSFLLETSFPSRTSPTTRGKWIVQNILGVSVPAPPPSVPALPEVPAGNALSMRGRLEAHTKNPRCAGCHSLIDPMGYAFEHFNATGQWQDVDETVAVDASGVFPDGTTFNGPAEFRWALVERRDAFVGVVASKLTAYAIGKQFWKAGADDADMPSVRGAVRGAGTDYRWASLIVEVVKSPAFQTRK